MAKYLQCRTQIYVFLQLSLCKDVLRTVVSGKLIICDYYLFVFSQVTKNKVWKDIAGLLNIGASSSAAYTLRKHYTKNLLPFECHFDRGGIDPQPIINQVEASSKKKGAKNASVPSPGTYLLYSVKFLISIFVPFVRKLSSHRSKVIDCQLLGGMFLFN